MCWLHRVRGHFWWVGRDFVPELGRLEIPTGVANFQSRVPSKLGEVSGMYRGGPGGGVRGGLGILLTRQLAQIACGTSLSLEGRGLGLGLARGVSPPLS